MKEYYQNYTKEQILKNQDILVESLYSWAETFDCEIDEDGEKSFDDYNFVFDLAVRLENNTCNDKDFDDINFHIWQINYDEVKIEIL
jgi:hypothetical protein